MNSFAAAIGRILISILFIVSGAGKLMDPHSADVMIASVGLPSGLGLITGSCEVAGGLLLALGLFRRLVATLLSIFTVVATALFHHNFADPVQLAMALKNLAIIGGLVLVLSEERVWHTTTRVMPGRRVDTADTAAPEDVAQARSERAEAAEARADTADLRAARTDATGTSDVPPRRPLWRFFSPRA